MKIEELIAFFEKFPNLKFNVDGKYNTLTLLDLYNVEVLDFSFSENGTIEEVIYYREQT